MLAVRHAGTQLLLHLRPSPMDAKVAPAAEVLGAMLATPLAATLTNLTLEARCVVGGRRVGRRRRPV